MTDAPSIDWPGKSGTKYRYRIYDINQTFKKSPANYIYAKKNGEGKWVPIYIGETGDLSDRTTDAHHQEDCITRNGATHRHVHSSSSNKQTRLNEETDLRNNFNTPCNKQ